MVVRRGGTSPRPGEQEGGGGGGGHPPEALLPDARLRRTIPENTKQHQNAQALAKPKSKQNRAQAPFPLEPPKKPPEQKHAKASSIQTRKHRRPDTLEHPKPQRPRAAGLI